VEQNMLEDEEWKIEVQRRRMEDKTATFKTRVILQNTPCFLYFKNKNKILLCRATWSLST